MLSQDLERFWAKVSRDSYHVMGMHHPCWMWKAGVDPKGRPRFFFGGSGMLAKKALVEMLLVGKLPDGYTVGSLCRNKLCVRPDHLVPCNDIDARAIRQGGTMDPGMMCHLRRLRTEGYTVEELAVMREVSVPLIRAILREGGLAE
jgi:hypothetical protein